MTKKTKIIISSASAAVICILAIVISVFLLTRGGGVDHLQAEGSGLTLIRNKLTFPVRNEWGESVNVVDDDRADFTDPNNENIFGLSGNVKMFPGDKYSAEMEIFNESKSAFDYWIEIKPKGELNEFAKQIRVTVEPEEKSGWAKKQATLDKGLTFGSGSAPVARVLSGGSSKFAVTLEFIHNSDLNGSAQNLPSAFDLVVYAAAYAG